VFKSTFELKIMSLSHFFLKRFIAQKVHTVCTRINYKIVPVTNLNKYLHYGTIKLHYMYINIGANRGSEKI